MPRGATPADVGVNLFAVQRQRRCTSLRRRSVQFGLRSAVGDWCIDAKRAEAKHGNISTWNTSEVTSFHTLFKNRGGFNDDIDSWQTGSVTNMEQAFADARVFNQPLNSWQTGSTKNFAAMFTRSANFNQALNSWLTGSATNMLGMFLSAAKFNQPLNSWQTGSAARTSSMFLSATKFNQALNSWQVGSVTRMDNMFNKAQAFNQNIDSWQTGLVRDMRSMFAAAKEFNQDIDSWQVETVSYFQDMFSGCDPNSRLCADVAFNQPLNSWKLFVRGTSNTFAVEKMRGMFKDATAFRQDLSAWTTKHNVRASVDWCNGHFVQPRQGKDDGVNVCRPLYQLEIRTIAGTRPLAIDAATKGGAAAKVGSPACWVREFSCVQYGMPRQPCVFVLRV